MLSVKRVSSGNVKKTISVHRSMLILGSGNTNYGINTIMHYTSSDAVNAAYGENSELSNAFKIANTFDNIDIFVANIKIKTDYIGIVDIIKQYNFSYIVPLGFSFSDSFYNPSLDRQVFYSEYYLNTIGYNSSTLIITTDNHASLYDSIDPFLNDMFNKITSFKSVATKALTYGSNLCFIANNLVSYEKANLILACVLCSCDLNAYPEYDYGEAVFDIDDFDVEEQEFAYFKNNVSIQTTIENLKNFRTVLDADKIVTIDKVIKFIERELDFDEFAGKPFTEYVRLKVYTKLSDFLKNNIGVSIRNYSIQSVDFITTSPGSGVIVNSFSILPINSTENFDIVMEV